MSRQALILAGGQGTRLRTLTRDRPKAMVEIHGKPLLEWQIEFCRHYGFDDIWILTHFGASYIEEYFGDGSKWNVRIQMHRETAPRGTAGAVLDALSKFEERFLVLYGDVFFNIDLGAFWDWHVDRKAEASLFIHPNSHPYDSDLVEVDAADRVTRVLPSPHPEGQDHSNLVNAALYVLEKRCLDPALLQSAPKIDFGKDLLPRLVREGHAVFGYQSAEYIKDLGTVDRYEGFNKAVQSGAVRLGPEPASRPAVFFDRDGTLNEERSYLRAPDDLVLESTAADALKRFNRSQYLSVLVTNQPVIARGECTFEGLTAIHRRMETQLGRARAYLDRIYFCPHHPDSGFEGEVQELKIACGCRKPATGMIDQAVRELKLRRQGSWMVGDTTVDLRLARQAGVRSVLVRTGHGGRDGRHAEYADFEVENVGRAADLILDIYPRLQAQSRELLTQTRAGDWIALGGPAHSGKSTLASTMKWELRDKGYKCEVVQLDRFLRTAEDRPGGPLGAYDLHALAAFVRSVRSGAPTPLPYYDRYRRVCTPQADVFQADKETVVLFEGVVALLVPELVEACQTKIFVEERAQVRQERFLNYHRWRGTLEDTVLGVFQQRENEEVPVVTESAAIADRVITASRET